MDYREQLDAERKDRNFLSDAEWAGLLDWTCPTCGADLDAFTVTKFRQPPVGRSSWEVSAMCRNGHLSDGGVEVDRQEEWGHPLRFADPSEPDA